MTVQQISRHAKRTRKKGESWLSAIKRSSRELKGKSTPRKKTARRKVGAAKKKASNRQTGSSVKFYDEQHRAKKPGKRRSASGKIYYERRKNRSDRPGTLTGIGAMKSKLKSHYENQLAGGLLARDKATTLKQHKAAVKKISSARKALNGLK